MLSVNKNYLGRPGDGEALEWGGPASKRMCGASWGWSVACVVNEGPRGNGNLILESWNCLTGLLHLHHLVWVCTVPGPYVSGALGDCASGGQVLVHPTHVVDATTEPQQNQMLKFFTERGIFRIHAHSRWFLLKISSSSSGETQSIRRGTWQRQG